MYRKGEMIPYAGAVTSESSKYAERSAALTFRNEPMANPETYTDAWTSSIANPYDQWIQVDFGVEIEVDVLCVFPLMFKGGARMPQTLWIQCSTDGVDWATLGRYSGLSWSDAQAKSFAIPATGQLVHANEEVFGVGDGGRRTYPLTYRGQPLRRVDNPTIRRRDWQGDQQLYATPRINLLRQSSDLTKEDWFKARGLSVSQDGMLGPDGVTAASLIKLLGGTDHQLVQKLPAALDVGSTYALSVWLKAGVGAFDFQLAYYDASKFVAGAMVAISGTAWQRREVALQIAFPAVSPEIRLVGYGNGRDGDAIYAANVQLEAGVASSGYIPTADSPTTITDYALVSTVVELTVAPGPSAELAWTGDGEI
ncbi:phage head spike fiber domain-containing protein [Burkholderia sp. 22313]|uniref:phage head spike fiber domain-containing protein n=1 Tax=Burkholderia sp. 22313 TaxID=3453908 RepID=UPI003F870C47